MFASFRHENVKLFLVYFESNRNKQTILMCIILLAYMHVPIGYFYLYNFESNRNNNFVDGYFYFNLFFFLFYAYMRVPIGSCVTFTKIESV